MNPLTQRDFSTGFSFFSDYDSYIPTYRFSGLTPEEYQADRRMLQEQLREQREARMLEYDQEYRSDYAGGGLVFDAPSRDERFPFMLPSFDFELGQLDEGFGDLFSDSLGFQNTFGGNTPTQYARNAAERINIMLFNVLPQSGQTRGNPPDWRINLPLPPIANSPNDCFLQSGQKVDCSIPGAMTREEYEAYLEIQITSPGMGKTQTPEEAKEAGRRGVEGMTGNVAKKLGVPEEVVYLLIAAIVLILVFMLIKR